MLCKRVLGLLLALSFTFVLASDRMSKLVRELDRMTSSQASFMVASFFAGENIGYGLTLSAMVWKESNFGKYLVNHSDGKYGSFGLAQILLTTAMRRNNVTTVKGREELRLRLTTDHAFNLRQAVAELRYWKNYYTGKTKYVVTHAVASYNNGWKGYADKKGKRYADDVKIRRKALVIWLQKESTIQKHPFLKSYFLEIKDILRSEGIIKH